jgi:hypothetical protein
LAARCTAFASRLVCANASGKPGLILKRVIIGLAVLPVGSIPPIAPLGAIGIKDFEELGTCFDAHHAEWVKEWIARDEPTTLGGVLKFLGRQIWTAYRHPIRAWRGEFDRPKKRTTDAGGTEPRIFS